MSLEKFLKKKYKAVFIQLDNNEVVWMSSTTQNEINHFIRNCPHFIKRICVRNKRSLILENLPIPKFQVKIEEES